MGMGLVDVVGKDDQRHQRKSQASDPELQCQHDHRDIADREDVDAVAVGSAEEGSRNASVVEVDANNDHHADDERCDGEVGEQGRIVDPFTLHRSEHAHHAC